MLAHKSYYFFSSSLREPEVFFCLFVFLYTHKHFIMFVDLMTPINQNVCGSLNILLWKVSFSVHSGKDSRDVHPNVYTGALVLSRATSGQSDDKNSRTSHLLSRWYETAMPWPGFQSMSIYLIVIRSVNTARMMLQLCWRGCKALWEHRFRKHSNGKPKQQRKNFTLFCSFCSSEHEKELLAFSVHNSFLTYKCCRKGHMLPGSSFLL